MIEVTEQIHAASENTKSVRLVNSCDDCKLASVCKYIDAYNKYRHEVRKIDAPDIIKVKISCTFYQSEHLTGPTVKHSESIYVR